MTLRWRIALILAAVAMSVGAFAGIVSYVSTVSQLRTGIDDTLRSRAAAVNTSTADAASRGGRGGSGGGGGDGPDGGGSDGGCPSPGSFQPDSAAQLVSTTGTVTSCIAGGPTLP
jgi:hypothetical protein